MSSNNTEQLLVLGAGVNEDGSLTNQTIDRAIRAAEYSSKNPVGLVVFSTGHSYFTPERKSGSSEAREMSKVAIKSGLPKSLVRLEEDSTTTFTNFIYSRHLLEPAKTVVVVAHDWQMPRALFVGKKVLSQRLSGLIVDADNPEVTTELEHTIYLATRILLAGIRDGDFAAVESRNCQIEKVAKKIPSPIKKALADHHSAFK